MTILGLRCSNKDFAYAILEGKKGDPQLVACNQHSYPIGFSQPQSLKWFLLELDKLIHEHNVKTISIKRHEGKVQAKNPYEDRIEHEAMILLAAANHDIRLVTKKVKSSMAKDLGQKGRSRYLARLDTSVFEGFDKYPTKIQEAILVAWSDLA